MLLILARSSIHDRIESILADLSERIVGGANRKRYFVQTGRNLAGVGGPRIRQYKHSLYSVITVRRYPTIILGLERYSISGM
jgi:hypothetical protein